MENHSKMDNLLHSWKQYYVPTDPFLHKYRVCNDPFYIKTNLCYYIIFFFFFGIVSIIS